MARTGFENLRVYGLAESLADRAWEIVMHWPKFPKDTIVRAADSIGANIAEGAGRGTYQDNRRFVRVARASLNETKHWLRRAYKRDLLLPDQTEELKAVLDELAPKLNAYLRSIGLMPTDKPSASDQLTTDN